MFTAKEMKCDMWCFTRVHFVLVYINITSVFTIIIDVLCLLERGWNMVCNAVSEQTLLFKPTDHQQKWIKICLKIFITNSREWFTFACGRNKPKIMMLILAASAKWLPQSISSQSFFKCLPDLLPGEDRLQITLNVIYFTTQQRTDRRAQCVLGLKEHSLD